MSPQLRLVAACRLELELEDLALLRFFVALPSPAGAWPLFERVEVVELGDASREELLAERVAAVADELGLESCSWE